jgi:hypothetical protein
MDPTGYLHLAYADSLSEFGPARALPSSRAWILSRAIPGCSVNDGMGCYPIFCCQNWSGLPSDLADLNDLVCLSLVTDPFGDYDSALLRQCFPDLVLPFKRHFVVDLNSKPDEFVSAHHRRNAKKALRAVTVIHCEEPDRYDREWIELYSQLIQRHTIRGIPAFSESALRRQLRVPGLQMFRAELDGEAVGMILWMVQNGIAYYHLGAYSKAGYRVRASFALFWIALEFFADTSTRWLSLGAAAGLRDVDDGLTRFKRGWSTGTRPAYLCGRILDRAAYARLLRKKAVAPHHYFPAYREEEFG